MTTGRGLPQDFPGQELGDCTMTLHDNQTRALEKEVGVYSPAGTYSESDARTG